MMFDGLSQLVVHSHISKLERIAVASGASLTAPGGVAQDLWQKALSSLIQHSGDGRLARPYIVTLVDYRLDAATERLWTIDLRTNQVLVNALVSHGSGTGRAENPRNQCLRVGNEARSELSSVGAFVTHAAPYRSAAGQKGGPRRSALRIDGLDTTNSNARERAIVFHGATYVTSSSAGRSDGCFATEQSVNDDLIPLIQGGTFVYSYFG